MFALLPGKLEVFKEWSSSKMDLRSYNLKEDGVGHGREQCEDLMELNH
jgi:hypothetical protein